MTLGLFDSTRIVAASIFTLKMRKIICNLLTLLTLMMAGCTAVETSQQVASSQNCPKPAITSSPNLVDANELQLRVNMPSPIHDDIRRIALIHPSKNSLQPELSGVLGKEARLTLEQIVANLRHSRPKIEIVERTNLDAAIEEIQTQMTGIIRDKDSARVGQMLGADHLFLYEIVLTTDKEMEYVKFNGGPVGAAVKAKIVQTETGKIVYLETITQSVTRPAPKSGTYWPSVQNDKQWTLGRALSGLSDSLHCAFIRNCDGVFIDSTYQGPGVRVSLVFRGSPGERAGIQQGDLVTKLNGVPVGTLREYAELETKAQNFQANIYTVKCGTDEKDYSVIVQQPKFSH